MPFVPDAIATDLMASQNKPEWETGIMINLKSSNIIVSIVAIGFMCFLSHSASAQLVVPNGYACEGFSESDPVGGDEPCGVCSDQITTRTLGSCTPSTACMANCVPEDQSTVKTQRYTKNTASEEDQIAAFAVYSDCLETAGNNEPGRQICWCAYQDSLFPCVAGEVEYTNEQNGCL